MDEPNIFAGLLVCEDFGKKRALRRAHTIDTHKNNFVCRNYNKNGKDSCMAHYIKESAIKTIVLDDLRRGLHLARNHEILFSKYLNKKSNSETQKDITKLVKKSQHSNIEMKNYAPFLKDYMRIMCLVKFLMKCFEP